MEAAHVQEEPAGIQVGDLEIRPADGLCLAAGRALTLSVREFQLLVCRQLVQQNLLHLLRVRELRLEPALLADVALDDRQRRRITFGIAKEEQRRLDLDPWREIWLGLKRLRGDRVLWLTVLGISYFWFLGALLQTDMVLCGTYVMGLSDSRTGLATVSTGVPSRRVSVATGSRSTVRA